MSWPMIPVSELCEFAVDCVNKTAPTVEHETEFKMIRTTNVKGGFIDLREVRFVTEEVFNKWTRRSRPQYGDVILTREAPVGEVGRFTSNDEKVFLGQRLFHYRPDPNKLDWNFLAYALQSPQIQGKFKGMGFGATVDHVRVGDAERLPIPCPPINVQKRIGDTLSAYDDLIENNRRRIQLLEQSARLLYKEWFVHLRFPGHEHTLIINGVPESWEKKHLSQIFNTQYGFTESATNDPVGPKFLRGTDINKTSYIDWSAVPYCPDEKLDFQKYKLQIDDILVIRMADPGKVAIVETEEKAVFASYLIRLTRKPGIEIPALYLFYVLASDQYQGFISGASGGSTRKSANAKLVVDFVTLIPTASLSQLFTTKIQPMRQQIQTLLQQNANLRKARDLLLPKLMNGEMAV